MGHFEDLGVPVVRPALMGPVLGDGLNGPLQLAPGPGDPGGSAWVYLNCQQSAGTLFLLAIDPASGRTLQYNAPEGPGAWAFVRGPDDRLYFGTWDAGALVMRFDPRHPEAGIVALGRPSHTETYLWEFARGPDGALYGCTYPHAKLVRVDPTTDAMEDLGRLDDDQMYARTLAVDDTGTLYAGIGYGRPDVVAWDVERRQRRALLTEAQRGQHTVATVRRGADGHVYAQLGGAWLRCAPDGLVATASPTLAQRPIWEDGWQVDARLEPDGRGSLLLRRGTTTRNIPFAYQGSGSRLFGLGQGPKGQVYGSSLLPLDLFRHDPETGALVDLGAPVGGGEIYSFLTVGPLLYMCSYPSSILFVYRPDDPWQPGKGAADNPRILGPVGDGHLRPHALTLDPAGRIWIGSAPPYGERGGALAVFDPTVEGDGGTRGRVVGNWRHLIPQQTIQALCLDPGTGLLWGGSSVSGGGGTTPLDADAHLFSWDPIGRKLITDVALPRARHVVALAVAEGLVMIATSPQNLVVAIDVQTGAERWRQLLPGSPYAQSLQAWQDGYVWALAGDRILRLRAADGALEVMGTAPEGIHCGMVLTASAVYFGHGAHLWRYLHQESTGQGSTVVQRQHP